MPAQRHPRTASASQRRSTIAQQQASQDSPPPHFNVTSGNTPGTPTTTRSVPLASRRAHVKSKRGCRTCKRRKVKCDEQHPSCGNCIKHAVTCDFVFEQSEAASSPGLGQTPGVSQPLPTNTSNHQTHHVPPRLSNINQQHDGGDLNMIDLQLLHNFTTFTHLTLSSDPAFRQMLTTTAISMAFDCQFLMRTILALSALHLARFRHSKRDYYINIGLGHYQVASRLATRRMDHLERLTREDCEHLHLFAVLTLFIALGMPKEDQNSLILGEAVVPNWLIMLRSAEPILRVLNPTTYRGRLSPLFSYGKQRWRVLYGDYSWKDGSLMVDLQAAINQSCTDPELLSIYNSVINRLRNVLSCLMPHTASGTGQERQGHQSDPSSPASAQQQMATPSLEAWDIFVWQWDSAKDFIPLLRGSAPQQEAMTIYAHFLVMLKKLENQWWLEGWATYLMERIWESLEDDYKSWVLWPIQELGWVPP